MSVIRIFRVRIDSVFRQEFEELFSFVALHKINEAEGFISASIHKPTKWNPDEYAMVSQWENEASLRRGMEPICNSAAWREICCGKLASSL
jgi:heme-degrading monooxygenase HmoA